MERHVAERLQITNGVLRGDNADLRARVKELEAVVDRLPKTADGVPQIPMLSCPWIVVYYPRPHVKNCYRWKFSGDMPGKCWLVSGDLNDNHFGPVGYTYSTRAVALAEMERAMRVGHEWVEQNIAREAAKESLEARRRVVEDCDLPDIAYSKLERRAIGACRAAMSSQRRRITMLLNERRAIFVYDAARLAAIAADAPIVPVPFNERETDFRKQFLDIIERQCGCHRSSSPEELHGSWMQAYLAMGWQYGEIYDKEKRIHPDLVPYSQLGQLERDKDAVFVALCEIARQYIYEAAEAAKKKP